MTRFQVEGLRWLAAKGRVSPGQLGRVTMTRGTANALVRLGYAKTDGYCYDVTDTGKAAARASWDSEAAPIYAKIDHALRGLPVDGATP